MRVGDLQRARHGESGRGACAGGEDQVHEFEQAEAIALPVRGVPSQLDVYRVDELSVICTDHSWHCGTDALTYVCIDAWSGCVYNLIVLTVAAS